MTAIAIASVWAAACVLWAYAYPRAVASAGGRAWRQALEEELAAAPDDRGRVAAVNDALREVEHDLDARQRLPGAAAALTAAGCFLALVGGALHRPGMELLGCVGVAVAGVTACLAARRSGQRRARAVRAAIDAEVEALVGDLYDVEVVLPAARRRRRRAGR